MGLVSSQRDQCLEYVQRNPVNCALLDQAARLAGLSWLVSC
jgi:uncharacterized protein YcsI (UPF0317 family)